MPVIIIGTVDDVQSYEGKNGFGANITISSLKDKRRKTLAFMTKDKKLAALFEENLQCEVTVSIELNQNSFGLRLGDVLEVVPAGKVS